MCYLHIIYRSFQYLLLVLLSWLDVLGSCCYSSSMICIKTSECLFFQLGSFKVPESRNIISRGFDEKKEEGKRKKSALDEIMESELASKKKRKETDKSVVIETDEERPWLKRGIVVKVVTKSLGEKYYKQKGNVVEVVGDDRMGAVVQFPAGGKVKLDQSHLETVVPGPERPVLILVGKHRGREAVLKELDVDNFCAKLKLVDTGDKLSLPYEHFSKLYSN